MTNSTTIGFIGAGNMASALIGGLSGKPDIRLLATDPHTDKVTQLAAQYSVHGCADNAALITQADVVVLAVKPQVIQSVLTQLTIPANKLILSIAAGIRTDSIQAWAKSDCAIVRSMPNTPALVKAGMTGLYANHHVNASQRQIAEMIMSAVGQILWVQQESDLDTVTALSGSGPAYFFYIMEAMEAAGVALGLSAQTSRVLTLQTALGAAKLALSSDTDSAKLRANVTSPGGTTEAAINTLQSAHCMETIKQAVMAAHQRSQQLAEQLADR